MDAENPTTGDSGASITDRLERYLAAESEPQQTKEAPSQESAPEPAATDKPENDANEDGKQPLTTSDVADLLGIDADVLDVDESGKVVIKAKIDGSESKAKLADLLKTYQLQGHAENKVREAAEKSKAADARMQEVEQAAQARLQQVEGLATVAARELMREFQSINWQALEQADAGQAALLRQKFAERNAQLQGVFQNVQQQRGMYEVHQRAQKAQFLQQEAQRLPEVIPEWKDPAVRAKESQEIVDWMKKQGATPEQVQAIDESTALQIAIVRRAMLFDRLQQAKPQIENKVRQAPKIVKPGQAAQDSKAEQLQNLKQSMKKTGGKNGTLEALLIAKGIA